MANKFVTIYDNDKEDIKSEDILIDGLFKFKLDKFQEQAIASIKNDRNVLVCVGTGSGKTVIAKYAIIESLRRGKRIIYTSPIKSLSNQKFDEFKSDFPDLGIMTGDIKFNPEADVLIMTTEILQNTLYRRKTVDFTETPTPSNLLMFDMDIDKELACVIFDEVQTCNIF